MVEDPARSDGVGVGVVGAFGEVAVVSSARRFIARSARA
jgi:hypothetical protein